MAREQIFRGTFGFTKWRKSYTVVTTLAENMASERTGAPKLTLPPDITKLVHNVLWRVA